MIISWPILVESDSVHSYPKVVSGLQYISTSRIYKNSIKYDDLIYCIKWIRCIKIELVFGITNTKSYHVRVVQNTIYN